MQLLLLLVCRNSRLDCVILWETPWNAAQGFPGNFCSPKIASKQSKKIRMSFYLDLCPSVCSIHSTLLPKCIATAHQACRVSCYCHCHLLSFLSMEWRWKTETNLPEFFDSLMIRCWKVGSLSLTRQLPQSCWGTQRVPGLGRVKFGSWQQ